MVAYPYTKLMMAIMDVDMAAAVLLASDEAADRLGVPADRRVYLRGWGYAEDPNYVAERRRAVAVPGHGRGRRAALAGAGVGVDDVAHLDLYSCFASSVGFAVDALGLDHDRVPDGGRPVTVTGGLPYHGGPGSNYMTHSLAAMAERLRADPGAFGLASGVGMHMTKHAFGVWSTEPGPLAPARPAGLAAELAADLEVVAITDTVDEAAATVAAYTVLHGRDGAPEWGVLVCDLPDGTRCYGRLEDPDALALAEHEELVGRTVHAHGGRGRGQPGPAVGVSAGDAAAGGLCSAGRPAAAGAAAPSRTTGRRPPARPSARRVAEAEMKKKFRPPSSSGVQFTRRTSRVPVCTRKRRWRTPGRSSPSRSANMKKETSVRRRGVGPSA